VTHRALGGMGREQGAWSLARKGQGEKYARKAEGVSSVVSRPLLQKHGAKRRGARIWDVRCGVGKRAWSMGHRVRSQRAEGSLVFVDW
jgi:hypothetical protein